MRANTMLRMLVVVLMLAVPFFLAGCEGDQGPAGPAGPEGPQGPPGQDGEDGHDGVISSDYTFVGAQGTRCSHCHAQMVEDVLATKHTNAYTDLDEASRDNPYCLKCHTTGWDSPVAYGQTEITEYGPDVNGYDDYWHVEGDLAAERRAALEGVQCESCHGAMGNQTPPSLTLATVIGPTFPDDIVSPCFPCHSTQFAEDEYPVSGHGTVLQNESIEEFRSHFGTPSCDYCHTSEGFVRTFDQDFVGWTPQEYNLIGCVTCHDPHKGAEGGGNEGQLRTLAAVTPNYTAPYDPDDPPTMEGYGPGQLCAQCHRARATNASLADQIALGSSRFGPHHSSQMDLFIGYGSYEIPGKEYDHTHAHQFVETACVQCHMRRDVVQHGELQEHSFHSFAPDPGNCAQCHPNLTDFNYGNGQTEVEDLMNDLASRFGYADYHAMVASTAEGGWNSRGAGVTTWQREAAYALYFLYNDGSKGAHNPSYARSLLQNAIDYYDEHLPGA